jgi:hypothetical protein
MLVLLLHLLKVIAETRVFGSASGLGCRVVVESPQAIADKIATFLVVQQQSTGLAKPFVWQQQRGILKLIAS